MASTQASGSGASASASQAPLPGALDVHPLRLLALRSLLSALDAIPEGKTLLLDPALAGPLGLVADVSALRQHGVERMFWLEEHTGNKVPRTDASASQAGGQERDRTDKGKRKVNIVPVNAPTRAVVYICRPESRWLRVIAGHVLADRRASPKSLAHTYHLLLSPRRTELSLHLLSELSPSSSAENVDDASSSSSLLADLHLYDLPLEFVPLEEDLLSLEDPRAWSRCSKDGDLGTLHETALACMTLQHLWGTFPRIVGKGDAAQRFATLLTRQRKEALAADPKNAALTASSQSVDCLVVLDRSADLVTPLCTQLTYEGLLDEVLGINSAHIEVDSSLLAANGPASPSASGAASGSGTPLRVTMTSPTKKKKHRLDNASDSLFSSIRDCNFAVVGEVLHRAAQRLSADYEGRHAAQTVAQMRAFVGKLGGLQASHLGLRVHTSLTERIMGITASEHFNASLEIQQNIVAGVDLPAQLSAIEALIASEAPLLMILRLLCLLSVVGGGIKQKNLDALIRDVLQTYGYTHLPLLLALQKVGLLVPAPAVPRRGAPIKGIAAVRGQLRLINDEVDERDPKDIAYVYSGYAPLSCRLVQAVAQKEAILAPESASERNVAQASEPLAPRDVDNELAGGARVSVRPNNARRVPDAHPIVGWQGFEDAVSALPGATVDEVQLPSTSNASTISASGSTQYGSVPTTTTTTIVLFLGGVTYTEVAALRYMSSQTKNRRFLVATTGIINGDSLIRSLSNCSTDSLGASHALEHLHPTSQAQHRDTSMMSSAT
ncbi:Sec1-like protein [Ceraceosorus guamensis]|uniref:Sec1-like protein n=1 Tax=Ceraceosorus guamensis TaxID=1522189 RepID=A0A316W9N1_9BASI|nr:Sec1-like protein [Ceraceosorus guamensis]PWN46244.1 Sec1-like protein [Ceraceosorus guamensis]